jgi:hypothetical protein
VLELWNRSERPATVASALGAELQVSCITLSTAGQPLSEDRTELVVLPSEPHTIEPGSAWELPITLKTESAWAQPFIVQRIAVQGRIVRVAVESAGRSWDRAMRVPYAVVFRARENAAGAVRDPLGAMRTAIAAGDADTLLVASVVAAWEDRVDEAVEALLDGAKAKEPVASASFVLLRLLTGENFGTDRGKWIAHYLSHERLSGRGVFGQW